MTDLEKTNSAVYRIFSNRNNVVRRTDRVWAGLSTSTDLVTEQVLMHSVQSVFGRRTWKSESQRAQWILSMPAIAEINNSMQEFTGQKIETSDQHREAYDPRIQSDDKDRKTFLGYLSE